MSDQYAAVKAIAVEAGEVALRYFAKVPSLDVESKGHLDLVTIADREVERFIAGELSRAYPDDGIFGEEGSAVDSKSGRTWVIDPIDGTFNFVRGSSGWGVSIGLFENGRPTFGVVNVPARDELFVGGDDVPASLNGERLPRPRPFDPKYAALAIGVHPDIPKERGLKLVNDVVNDLDVAYRVTGCAIVSLIDVAMGGVDGYISLGTPSWDILGMIPCLQQLGIVTTIDWPTAGLNTKMNFVCGTPEIVELSSRLIR